MTQESFLEMSNVVYGWYIDEATESAKAYFRNCTKDDLLKYHHCLGQAIRNYFKLWEREWTPEIYDYVDISPDHPDNLSMRIIVDVWQRLQDE